MNHGEQDNLWRKALVDTALDAVIIMDCEGKILDFNASAEQVFGFEKSDTLGKDLAELIIPEAMRAAHGSRLAALRSGASPKILGKRLELPALRANGEEFPSELIVVQVPGDPPVFVGTIRDISDRVSTEAALRESAQRFRNLANSAAQLIWLCDQDGDAIWFNHAWTSFAGIEQDELVSRPNGWTDLVHPEDRYLVRDVSAEAEIDQTVSVEVRFQNAAGEYRWHLCNRARTQGAQDGEAFVWSGVEITSRREVEEALRLTQIAMDFAADAVFWVMEDALLDYVNEQACQMLGYTQEELLHLSVPDFSPEIPDGGWESHWNRLRNEKNLRFETTHRRKDGSVFPVEISLNYVNYKGVELNCAFARDISERNRVKEVLSRSMKEAQDANRAKSEFLALVSHEMRTPLTSILGSLDLCIQSLDAPETEQLLKLCRNSGKHLKSLIGDILDYSQIQAGKFSLRMKPVDLNSTFEAIKTSFVQKVSQKGLEFRTRSTFFSTPVVADDRRLTQVVTNLLSNAVKFTESGFIGLTIENYEECNDFVGVRVIVEDTGVGIPEEQRDRIFQRFEQLESGISRSYGGVGLGLSICHQLVEMMGGEISIADGFEGQTKFQVELRLKKSKSSTDLSAGTESVNSPSSGRPRLSGQVLVVEDDPASRIIVQRIIERMGPRVALAHNGRRAIELIGQNSDYDLVLMDIMMPEMDGVATSRALRELGFDAPIAAMSAHSQVDGFDQLNALFAEFIEKPIETDKLRTVLERFLRSVPSQIETENFQFDRSLFMSQCDYDLNLATEIVQLYRASTLESWEEIKKLWDIPANYGRIGELVHKLKGASENIGAISLAKTCRLTEEKMKGKIPLDAQMQKALGFQIERILERIQLALRELYSQRSER